MGFLRLSQGCVRRFGLKRWTPRCSGRTTGWSRRCSTPRPGPSTPKSCWHGWKSVSIWVSQDTGGGINTRVWHVRRQQWSKVASIKLENKSSGFQTTCGVIESCSYLHLVNSDLKGGQRTFFLYQKVVITLHGYGHPSDDAIRKTNILIIQFKQNLKIKAPWSRSQAHPSFNFTDNTSIGFCENAAK